MDCYKIKVVCSIILQRKRKDFLDLLRDFDIILPSKLPSVYETIQLIHGKKNFHVLFKENMPIKSANVEVMDVQEKNKRKEYKLKITEAEGAESFIKNEYIVDVAVAGGEDTHIQLTYRFEGERRKYQMAIPHLEFHLFNLINTEHINYPTN